MQSQTLLHADIFFFVATIGFSLITICIFICLIYMIGIFRNVKRLTEKIESGMSAVELETREMVEDLRDSTAFKMLFGSKRKKSARPTSSSSMPATRRRVAPKKKLKEKVAEISEEV